MKKLMAIAALGAAMSVATGVAAQGNGNQGGMSGSNHGAAVSAAAHSDCTAPHRNNPMVVNHGGCVSAVAHGQPIGTSSVVPGIVPGGQQ